MAYVHIVLVSQRIVGALCQYLLAVLHHRLRRDGLASPLVPRVDAVHGELLCLVGGGDGKGQSERPCVGALHGDHGRCRTRVDVVLIGHVIVGASCQHGIAVLHGHGRRDFPSGEGKRGAVELCRQVDTVLTLDVQCTADVSDVVVLRHHALSVAYFRLRGCQRVVTGIGARRCQRDGGQRMSGEQSRHRDGIGTRLHVAAIVNGLVRGRHRQRQACDVERLYQVAVIVALHRDEGPGLSGIGIVGVGHIVVVASHQHLVMVVYNDRRLLCPSRIGHISDGVHSQ